MAEAHQFPLWNPEVQQYLDDVSEVLKCAELQIRPSYPVLMRLEDALSRDIFQTEYEKLRNDEIVKKVIARVRDELITNYGGWERSPIREISQPEVKELEGILLNLLDLLASEQREGADLRRFRIICESSEAKKSLKKMKVNSFDKLDDRDKRIYISKFLAKNIEACYKVANWFMNQKFWVPVPYEPLPMICGDYKVHVKHQLLYRQFEECHLDYIFCESSDDALNSYEILKIQDKLSGSDSLASGVNNGEHIYLLRSGRLAVKFTFRSRYDNLENLLLEMKNLPLSSNVFVKDSFTNMDNLYAEYTRRLAEILGSIIFKKFESRQKIEVNLKDLSSKSCLSLLDLWPNTHKTNITDAEDVMQRNPALSPGKEKEVKKAMMNDHIARSKKTGYQTISFVFYIGAKNTANPAINRDTAWEVQIRDPYMNFVAEHGTAKWTLYKKDKLEKLKSYFRHFDTVYRIGHALLVKKDESALQELFNPLGEKRLDDIAASYRSLIKPLSDDMGESLEQLKQGFRELLDLQRRGIIVHTYVKSAKKLTKNLMKDIICKQGVHSLDYATSLEDLNNKLFKEGYKWIAKKKTWLTRMLYEVHFKALKDYVLDTKKDSQINRLMKICCAYLILNYEKTYESSGLDKIFLKRSSESLVQYFETNSFLKSPKWYQETKSSIGFAPYKSKFEKFKSITANQMEDHLQKHGFGITTSRAIMRIFNQKLYLSPNA